MFIEQDAQSPWDRQAELRISMRETRRAASRGRGREDRGSVPRLTRRRRRSRTRSSRPTRACTPTTRRSSTREGRGDGGDRGLDAREGELRRGLRQRARDRLPLSAERTRRRRTRRSSISRARARSARTSSSLVLGLRRFPSEERARADVSRSTRAPTSGETTSSPLPEPTAFWRDHVIVWSKDLGRSLDYLETRKDIDAEDGLRGLSWGGPSRPSCWRSRSDSRRPSSTREASSSSGPSRKWTRSTSCRG